MAVNLRGPFLCSQAVLPSVMKRRWGKIICISSDSGKKGWATGAAYCDSKSGLLGLSGVLSEEVADAYGINVNAICPGGVDTPMARKATSEAGMVVDREKLMSPSDIASVAVSWPATSRTPRTGRASTSLGCRR